MSELRNWVRSRSFSRGVRRWMNDNQLLWKMLENNRPNLREFRFSHHIVNLKHARNASFLPVIRAQSSPVGKRLWAEATVQERRKHEAELGSSEITVEVVRPRGL
ncbi:hypothetical protein M0R45_015982 [Rubus argutus]|uniref:Uncharacterized protein n=1 Tax=Rubus argutus TaxID=59490 RepID=A0AAW1WGR0_RUBAR